MEILQNSWIIGIFSSIISGVVVFLVTNFIFSRKENKLYNQRLIQGNNELITIIKPIIVEKNKFNNDLLISLIIALSQKYNINKHDLYSINDIACIIITDILQTPFLNSEQKENYCNEIIEVKNNIINIKNENKISEKIIMKSTLTSKYISTILGLVTVFTSVFLMFFLLNEIIAIEYSYIITSLIAIIPIISISIVSILQKYIKKKNKDLEERKVENSATAHNKR